MHLGLQFKMCKSLPQFFSCSKKEKKKYMNVLVDDPKHISTVINGSNNKQNTNWISFWQLGQNNKKTSGLGKNIEILCNIDYLFFYKFLMIPDQN